MHFFSTLYTVSVLKTTLFIVLFFYLLKNTERMEQKKVSSRQLLAKEQGTYC
ncbi:hypothetical protein MKZ08_06720 [Viridibacillus sp. FSL R5-0477]|uniref:hypothetical protein n=1 Tax=Viridibacillus TaxID=496496 RepID=UPI0004B1AE2F|nr:hypothetical protein [Viridibacillus arenosi]